MSDRPASGLGDVISTAAPMLITLKRDELLKRAVAARKLQKTQATEQMVAACEELAS